MGGFEEVAVCGVRRLSTGYTASKWTTEGRWRCCQCPRYGSCRLTMRAGSTFLCPCWNTGKAHCCNGLNSRWRASQTAKSDRVKAFGGKPWTRPPQVKNPTLSGADDRGSGKPTGPRRPQ